MKTFIRTQCADRGEVEPFWGHRFTKRFASAAAVIALVGGSVISWSAHAEPDQKDWGARPYEYLIVEQDLRTVLEEYGHNLGLRVALTPAVQGRVKGNMPHGSARVFLDAVSRAYGLDWFYDGYTLHVSTASEGRSRAIELHDVAFQSALDLIKAAGLHDERYQFRPGPGPTQAMVSGPPRFVEAVADAVSSMPRTRAPAVVGAQTMRVFRGGAAVDKVTFP